MSRWCSGCFDAELLGTVDWPGNPGTPGRPISPFKPGAPGRPGEPWRERGPDGLNSVIKTYKSKKIWGRNSETWSYWESWTTEISFLSWETWLARSARNTLFSLYATTSCRSTGTLLARWTFICRYQNSRIRHRIIENNIYFYASFYSLHSQQGRDQFGFHLWRKLSIFAFYLCWWKLIWPGPRLSQCSPK